MIWFLWLNYRRLKINCSQAGRRGPVGLCTCINSGGWRFESRHCLILLDKMIEKLNNEEQSVQRRGLRGTKIGLIPFVHHYISLRVGTHRTRTRLENHIGKKERRDLNYQLQVWRHLTIIVTIK